MERGLLIRIPQPGWAVSAFEQLLPGGHACVFGPHREALAAEEAGFEVRDCIVAFGLGVQQRVWLLRKPIEAQNVAAQVLKTGTGGLWIDGCRVGVTGATKRSGQAAYPLKADGTEDRSGSWARTGHSIVPVDAGRWPPNLVFIHGPECRQQGHRSIRGNRVDTRPEDDAGRSDKSQWRFRPTAQTKRGYSGEDGLETVANWDCESGCPVRALDEQSLAGGMHSAGNKRSTVRQSGALYEGGFAPLDNNPDFYQDAGGASRFFPQFKDDAELDAWLRRLILGAEE